MGKDRTATETQRRREEADSSGAVKLNQLTEQIIGCAIEVHKHLGPGLLESLYEKALVFELTQAGLRCQSQVVLPIVYKGSVIGEHRLDLIVENEVILEIKAVERFDNVFQAQILSYIKLSRKRLGLLINFNVPVLKEGIVRVIL